MSAIGFPDFRRQIDYDLNPNLMAFGSTATPHGTVFGPFNVANFAYLAGQIILNTGMGRFVVEFAADLAFVFPMGTWRVMLDSGSAATANLRVPVQGRYARITFFSSDGLAKNVQAVVTASNRGNTVELRASTAMVIFPQSPNVPAGGTGTILPTQLGNGVAMWETDGNTVSSVFTLDFLDDSGTWDIFAVRRLPTGAADNGLVILPPAPVRMRCINNGGAPTTFNVSLIQNNAGN